MVSLGFLELLEKVVLARLPSLAIDIFDSATEPLKMGISWICLRRSTAFFLFYSVFGDLQTKTNAMRWGSGVVMETASDINTRIGPSRLWLRGQGFHSERIGSEQDEIKL